MTVSNSQTQADDAKQRKREMKRAMYAEQRNEINRKRREKYQIKNKKLPSLVDRDVTQQSNLIQSMCIILWLLFMV